ncbi:MAG: hypothetical protein IKP68_12230 [Clostridia bacterium]|nr:hypothetical protein [Clostridia bacterium]
MRNLTVKRKKSFVGSVMKLKVYIEDGEAEDIVICGVHCRKLGDLKNGEEKTFEVGEASARVFVICDAVSKDYCNDMYILPEGEESVSISGVCKFNLFNGNAFRFDGTPSEEALLNRKKYKKKGSAILIIAIICGLLAGFFVSRFFITANSKPTPKDFSANGITLTLDTSFKAEDKDPFMFYAQTKTVAVLASKDDFEKYPALSSFSIDEYAGLLTSSGKFDNLTEVMHESGLTYRIYDFTYAESGTTYTYFTSFYKTDSAFWTVQFTTTKNAAEKYRADIIKWAQSVSFE